MGKIRHVRSKGRSTSMIKNCESCEYIGMNLFGYNTTWYPINPDLAQAMIETLTEYMKLKSKKSPIKQSAISFDRSFFCSVYVDIYFLWLYCSWSSK